MRAPSLLSLTIALVALACPASSTAQTAPARHRPQEEAIAASPAVGTTRLAMFRNGDVTLAGFLSVPAGTGPFMGVVLLPVSGPTDRDAKDGRSQAGPGSGRRPEQAWDRRVAFRQAGRRGIDRDARNGDRSRSGWRRRAAVAWLSRQPQIGTIGIVGHSEGAVLAPIVASNDSAVRFVVLLGGAAIRGEDLLIAQDKAMGEAAGQTPEALANSLAIKRKVFAEVEGASDMADAKARIQTAVASDVAAGTLAVEDFSNLIDDYASPWMRHFLTYDPAPALRTLKTPILALYGSKDLQVSPALNAAALSRANPAAEVRILPGLNHMFETAETGLPREYGRIEETVAPAALRTISDWIVQRR
jgi:fermentation-respiration switch protein FrsA (DUF1100 family)